MRRREFITLFGSTAVWLFAAGAQQSSLAQETRGAKIAEVGFFYPGTVEASKVRITAFLKGLQDKGYVEGRNVALITRLTELHPERLAPLAAGAQPFAALMGFSNLVGCTREYSSSSLLRYARGALNGIHPSTS